MTSLKLVAIAAVALSLVGCESKPKLSQLAGKVTFKGNPVPAGWISFTPDVSAGGLGQVRVLQIKDGVYNSATENEPGITPGAHIIQIAGFDGVKIKLWGQGKQIFNPIKDNYTVPEGESTHDFEIPSSAGENVLIQPTADE